MRIKIIVQLQFIVWKISIVVVVVELEIFKSWEMNICFGHMSDDDLFTVAAFLDPNHKLKWCKKKSG